MRRPPSGSPGGGFSFVPARARKDDGTCARLDESGTRWARERLPGAAPGTYELCGPEVNGDPEQLGEHRLVPHATAEEFGDVPRHFDGLMTWLRAHPEFEGVVWHHPDGRMAKLKHRDAVASA